MGIESETNSRRESPQKGPEIVVDLVSLRDKIVAVQQERGLHPITIAMEGMSGSGKSHTAERLAGLYPGKAALLSVDLFFLIPRSEFTRVPSSVWMERVESGEVVLKDWYDLGRIKAILQKMRERKSFVETGLYNLATGLHDKEVTIDAAGCELVVLEGLFSADETLRDEIDLVVFLDVPQSVALARAEKRDKAERDTDNERWRLKEVLIHTPYLPHAEKARTKADIIYSNPFEG